MYCGLWVDSGGVGGKGYNLQCGVDAIECGGGYTTGVSCPLATRVEVLHFDVLTSKRIARNTDGTT